VTLERAAADTGASPRRPASLVPHRGRSRPARRRTAGPQRLGAARALSPPAPRPPRGYAAPRSGGSPTRPSLRSSGTGLTRSSSGCRARTAPAIRSVRLNRALRRCRCRPVVVRAGVTGPRRAVRGTEKQVHGRGSRLLEGPAPLTELELTGSTATTKGVTSRSTSAGEEGQAGDVPATALGGRLGVARSIAGQPTSASCSACSALRRRAGRTAAWPSSR